MKQLQYFEIPKVFRLRIANSLINRKNFVFEYKLDDKVRIINAT
jgi:hypothetical protein